MSDQKKVKKPIDPLAMKPGQNYGSTKFKPSKEYDSGNITYKEVDKEEKEKK